MILIESLHMIKYKPIFLNIYKSTIQIYHPKRENHPKKSTLIQKSALTYAKFSLEIKSKQPNTPFEVKKAEKSSLTQKISLTHGIFTRNKIENDPTPPEDKKNPILPKVSTIFIHLLSILHFHPSVWEYVEHQPQIIWLSADSRLSLFPMRCAVSLYAHTSGCVCVCIRYINV